MDATNLERNFYLAFLLKELEVPVLFILNFMDVVKTKKIEINIDRLSELLDAPVIPTIAIKKKGITEVKDLIKNAMDEQTLIITKEFKVIYSKEIEENIKQTIKQLKINSPSFLPEKRRWAAIKILERDKEVLKELSTVNGGKTVIENVKEFASESLEFELAKQRYNKISEIIHKIYKQEKGVLTISDILDQVFLHKYFGIPIFLIIMWAMFEFTFRVSAPLVSLIEVGLDTLGNITSSYLAENAWYTSFIVDGIIGGFGAILGFVPLIFMLFLVLSFLEDSGYLSRAAFVMDRAMNKIGLHGRSFVSMILGFGCNVPAVMSCRAIESEEDRLTTILVNQNISCSARLPVYMLFGGAVWSGMTGTIIFFLYSIGILVAIGMALFFRKIIFKGEAPPFVLELGDYRMPTFKYTGIHMWERGREFIKKAGWIIFTTVVVMWLLLNIGIDGSWAPDIEHSLLAGIGKLVQPLFAPLNWSWIATAGLIFGFLAKEVVVAMFGLVLIGAEEGIGLGEAAVAALPATSIATSSVPILVFGYLVFVLLYTPCVPHIGAVYKETGSKKWTLVSASYGIFLGYLFPLAINFIGGIYF